MTAQEINLDNIANNLARLKHHRIPGAARAIFRSALSECGDAGSRCNAADDGRGRFADWSRHAPREYGDHADAGHLQQHGQSTGLCDQGTGFFQILLPNNQIGYTRAGSFQTDSQGNLVTANGNALQPAIVIPPNATNITVGSDGTVSVTLPGQNQTAQVGVIQLASFFKSRRLEQYRKQHLPADYRIRGACCGDCGRLLRSGYDSAGNAEQSNVSVVDEFVNMILAQTLL